MTYFFLLLFCGLIGYLVQFMVRDSQKIINNPYNKRQDILAERVIRGKVLSSDKKVLAKTQTNKKGQEIRVYPYGKLFAHVVGRIKNSMTGVELAQCYPMLTSHSDPITQIENQIKGKKNLGDNVITTLNYKLQKAAYDALGNHKGAIVALEPSTGKVLAMVSKPDYNPNTIQQDWNRLIKDKADDSALLNRATQGLYPPGSTFKILTAMEYILENKDYKKYRYTCKGTMVYEGNSISCYDKEHHGVVNLKQSFADSCNTSFANIGLGLHISDLRSLCEKFLFNKSLSVDFEYNKSSFVLDQGAVSGDIMQTVIGQGKTTITPLQNAMITATIANNGKMMKPYVVDHTENAAGKTVTTYSPKLQGNIISTELAKQMQNYMRAVVNSGTASSLRYLPYKVAGKTGSAEIDAQGTTHSWFVGFAPLDNPKIAVSIVVEGAGTGSQFAVPIAKKLISTYLSK